MSEEMQKYLDRRLDRIEAMLGTTLEVQGKQETRISMLESHKATVTRFLWTITGGIVTIGVFVVKNYLGV